MSNAMDFNVGTEFTKAGVGLGGAAVSVVTLNTVVTVMTIVYLSVVLFNATPKMVETFKHWRDKVRSRKGGKRGD